MPVNYIKMALFDQNQEEQEEIEEQEEQEREKSIYNLILCELHYTPIHGKTNTSCPDIEGHYLVIDRYDGLTGISLDEIDEYGSETEDDDDDEDDGSEDFIRLSEIQDATAEFYMEEFNIPARQIPHKLLRNYHNIIRDPNYIKPEIAECIQLPTGECIAIIKTMWIKIIQRKWKNVYAARKHIIKCWSCPSSLFTRRLTGYWPIYCRRLPELKGMLSDLK